MKRTGICGRKRNIVEPTVFNCDHIIIFVYLIYTCSLESTFDMLKYFSVVSFLALIGLTAYQVLYMKRYFKSKKLI